MVRVKASQNALNLRPAMYCPLSVPLEGRRGETTARYSVQGVQAIEKRMYRFAILHRTIPEVIYIYVIIE
jgi:hypothetical protein